MRSKGLGAREATAVTNLGRPALQQRLDPLAGTGFELRATTRLPSSRFIIESMPTVNR